MDTDVLRRNNGADYNHSIDPEYQRLRAAADDAIKSRQKLSAESQKAYKSGDKAKAHQLSEEAKKKAALADTLNLQAAEYVFVQNNADSSSNEIDLHGLYVKEAMWILKKRMAFAADKGELELRIITGKGNHSQNHISKIKEETIELCQSLGLNYHVNSKNTGVVIVEVDKNKIPTDWVNPESTVSEPKPSAKIDSHTQYQQSQNTGYQPQQGPTYQHGPSYQQQPQQQSQTSAGGIAALVAGLLCLCLNNDRK
ncbi:Smr domain profile [Nakaseomyces glabratus]